MAGTIAMSPERRWSAAGWLFDWTVDFLAANVGSPDLKTELEEIVTENLGWLGLGDYGVEADREMRELLRAKLVGSAEESFSSAMPGRNEVLDHLRHLAAEV